MICVVLPGREQWPHTVRVTQPTSCAARARDQSRCRPRTSSFHDPTATACPSSPLTGSRPLLPLLDAAFEIGRHDHHAAGAFSSAGDAHGRQVANRDEVEDVIGTARQTARHRFLREALFWIFTRSGATLTRGRQSIRRHAVPPPAHTTTAAAAAIVAVKLVWVSARRSPALPRVMSEVGLPT